MTEIASPTVSIVIATYNYGRYLAAAVRSALAQTWRDFEIVIVDDGSTDDTTEVLRLFAAEPQVRTLVTAHVGQPAAKNAGIRAARGEFVAFLDADDIWSPEKLSRQMPLFARPEVGVVYSSRRVIDEAGQPRDWQPRPLHRGCVVAELFRDNFVCFSSAVVRRGVFDRTGLFDESLPLAIDYDLWLRAAQECEFDYIDAPLVSYRTGHANLSRREVERLRIALGIMDRYLSRPEARALMPRAAVRLAYAETYTHLALVQRERGGVSAAWKSCLQALRSNWRHGPAWKVLISLLVPARGRCWYRRWRGQPGHWNLVRTGAARDLSPPTPPGVPAT